MGSGETKWSLDEFPDKEHINRCRQVSHTHYYGAIVLIFCSFTEAMDTLSVSEMLAPAYFIVGGVSSGEVSDIVTRNIECGLILGDSDY